MRLAVAKSTLESLLINLQPFLEKKDTSQITSHVLLIANENKMVAKATDQEIGLQATTEHVDIHINGKATANGKKLLDIVRILKEDDIILETIEETLHITQGNSKFKLPMFNAEEFPEFPDLDDLPSIELNSMELIQMFKKVSPAIDTNNPKYELNGALLNIKENEIDIVGTDTRRLAIGKIENSNDKTLSMIIPKKAIIEIQKLFFDQIEIFYNETNLIIKTPNYYFYTHLINGKYPDYERIVPKSLKHSIILPKSKIIESIKQITTISQEIKMTFKNNSIIFKSLGEENSEAETEMEFNTGFNEEFVLAVNSKYLLDFLGQIDNEEFNMGLNEPNLPFIVQSGNFYTVIMPIII
ncbi:DNA polymerase III subunit beta [Hydrogenimonas thermophila]|uniref:Beta sliding clamp n=1 Tax=Hydrogenimonas thermophila TaxID=223786 RepID=A0A1I5LGL8_9BACT|nr:DNA polymerase III subunit beta [Hydrogenimonas thermophila]WOE69990.1 DNA polymerase III subunit beta [Hydrogenimonas thermophila]WOE72507.1 DNA polymerase III subunit beta [Hydrogenimonas thermophila]SFO95996.1 DNA polymerase III, beta subunit [Hydrogenimonas thermophila]